MFNNNLIIFLVMFMSGKKCFLIIIATVLLTGCVCTSKDVVDEAVEGAYWLGQMDAARGRIRVNKDTGEWIKLDSLIIEQGMDEYPKFIYGKSKLGIKLKEKAEEINYFND